MVSQTWNGSDMAYYTIQKRMKADGSARYRCTVGIKDGGKHLYRESRTFGKQIQAKSWGAKRAAELEASGIPSENTVNITTGALLKRYLDDPTLGAKAGRTKRYVIQMLIDCDLSDIMLTDLSVNNIIEHCRHRHAAGAGPATLSHDVTYLASVLDAAKPVYGIDYTNNPAKDSRATLTQMGLIGKSQRRSRRPQSDELERMMEGLKARSEKAGSKIPFCDILEFSILTCMRIGEVCKIRWDDIDENQRAALVRDRKDPRKKTGNHMLVPLLGKAWDIAMRQPKTDDRIFPYNATSVTAGFQRVRGALGITDLRYHDMRREGASRLFEAGFSIEEVAQVTGHRSLNVLWQVYTELYPKSLHERFNELTRRKLADPDGE